MNSWPMSRLPFFVVHVRGGASSRGPCVCVCVCARAYGVRMYWERDVVARVCVCFVCACVWCANVLEEREVVARACVCLCACAYGVRMYWWSVTLWPVSRLPMGVCHVHGVGRWVVVSRWREKKW